MNSDQFINQSSLVTSYYTPAAIADAAREVLGEIELDPASCEEANTEIIKASRYYGAPFYLDVGNIGGLPLRRFENWGGLSQDWTCETMFMNHPFGKSVPPCKLDCTKKDCTKRGYHTAAFTPGNDEWIETLTKYHQYGRVKNAINICFASTSEGWFRPLLKYPVCWIRGRVPYLLPGMNATKSPPKGSCCFYLGRNVKRFRDVFSELGEVHVPYDGISGSWSIPF